VHNRRVSETTTWPRLSVVIPAFNEEGAILPILDRVLALRSPLAAAGIGGPEVIVVDDGSSDRTGEVVQELGDVRLIRNGQNRGYGAALKTGFASATGDLIAFLDADGTYPPEAMPELCRAALDGADVVIGSRMQDSQSGMPRIRRIGNHLFAGMVSLLGTERIQDSASGMRIVRRQVLPKLYPLPDGLNFTPVMTLRAMHEGLRIVEVPIRYSERIGASKLRVTSDGMRFARSLVWTALAYNPVRILGALGLAGVAIALLIGLGLVAARLSGSTALGHWGVAAIFLALVAAVTGVSLFGLGATFNYLVSLLRRQPVRAGLFGKPLFDPPLERHFGWLGAAVSSAGLAIAVASFGLSLRGWEITRLWLYLVGSALFILAGVQLMLSWLLTRTLEALADREQQVRRDLAGGERRRHDERDHV
jgi:hypothetical protein